MLVVFLNSLYLLDERPCKDAVECNNPGVTVRVPGTLNSTYVHKSWLEMYPDGCNELPKDHGIHGISTWGGSLKFRCPKSRVNIFAKSATPPGRGINST